MILALDIGGTKLAAALWDGFKLLQRTELPTPTADRSPDSVVSVALELLRPLQARASSIAVATTGSVADGRVTALNADTLQGWNAFDLRGALSLALHLPAFVLNDADAAAWGEYMHGAGRTGSSAAGSSAVHSSNFAFVTVSTGIGGGLVLNGALHTTVHGLHAELGYTLASNDQPLEIVAGGAALDRWARARGWSGAREIVRRSLEGDAVTIAKLTESAGLVARAAANLFVTLGITRVAIGGGLGLSAGYLERVQATLAQLGEPWNALEVVRAELSVDAGLVGAAAWAAAQQAKRAS